ncbi:MAG TPA: hypothetical protein VMF65_19305, partial [Acidimicrobiales bacterium]|nr:hypothetical protein [Acidimicrobiales bacterium]
YSGEQIVDEGAICEAGGARRRATPAEAGIWGAKLSSEHTFAPQIDEGTLNLDIDIDIMERVPAAGPAAPERSGPRGGNRPGISPNYGWYSGFSLVNNAEPVHNQDSSHAGPTAVAAALAHYPEES